MPTDKKLWRNRKARKELARRLQSENPGLEVVHPRAAGIDVGNGAHYMAVRPDCDSQPVRRFECEPLVFYILHRANEVIANCNVDSGIAAAGANAFRTFGAETEYSFFHENIELRIASFGAREPRRRRCRLRQTLCSFLLRQRSGNTARQLDQTAYHLTRSDGGLLPPGADHFDRGAKKPWRRKHRLPRRCVTPPGSLFPLIPQDSPFRHNSRGDEGCRVPRVQIPVASAAPPNRTPDAFSSAHIPRRPASRAFAGSHRECPPYRCRGAERPLPGSAVVLPRGQALVRRACPILQGACCARRYSGPSDPTAG